MAKDTELHMERDMELYRVYLRGLREQHFSSLDEAADWVRMQPAPRFYISSKPLVSYIGARTNGTRPQKMFSQNEKKMKCLYNMYLDYIEQNPNHGMSREYICDILVDQPAPCFYISRESARRIIQRERKRYREAIFRRAQR